MAKISDVYEVISRAKTAGIAKATAAIKQHGNAIEKAGQQADKASGRFGRLRGMMGKVGGIAKAIALGGLAKLSGALGWLKDKLFGGEKALGGVGKAADKLGKGALKALTKGFKAAGQIAASTFGAIGKVGKGFVQKAAQTGKSALSVLGKGIGVFGLALGALALAAPLLGGLGDKIEQLSPRASAAMSRIGDAFGRVRDIFLEAILNALVPLLEKLADAMEDPRFIAFVQMLADKLAGAISTVVGFILNDLIPALVKLWKDSEPVRKAIAEGLGKVFDWLANTVMPVLVKRVRDGWEDIKAVINRVVTLVVGFVRTNWENITKIIRGQLAIAQGIIETAWSLISGVFETFLLILEGKWDSAWVKLKTTLSNAWDGFKRIISGAIDVITGWLGIFGEALRKPWEGLKGFIEEVWSGIKVFVERGINNVIHLINKLIKTYNDTIARLPGASAIDELADVHLAAGGIVRSPVRAIVGDNPRSPEVVAPLHDLVGILEQALGGLGVGPSINVYVTVAPGGFATPEEAGRRTADAMIDAARARGMRI